MISSYTLNVICRDEGFSETPYLDSLGYPTIGYGFKIGPKNAPLSNYTFTIPPSVALAWLKSYLDELDRKILEDEILSSIMFLLSGDKVRSLVIESMAYQMGLQGLLKFKKMLAAIDSGDFEKASEEMLDSLWAEQTPTRALRMSNMMRTGVLSDYYL